MRFPVALAALVAATVGACGSRRPLVASGAHDGRDAAVDVGGVCRSCLP